MLPQIIPQERDKARERWQIVLPNLQKNLNEIAYETWIPEIKPVTYRDNTLYLAMPQLKIGGFLEISSQITNIVRQCLLNDNLTLEAVPLEELDHVSLDKKKEELTIIGDYTFDNFVVGPSNREAYNYAKGIASREEFIKEINPLFIHGGSGLGKTHLLYAIYNETKKNFPKRKVSYCPGETWLNEFLDSLSGKQKEFKEKYRSMDLLIIDDVQFIAAKQQMQEELFYTFNELYTNKKQIVFTSDKPPDSLANIGERLISRFQSGVVIDVKSPDNETRMAIIKKKAEAKGVTLPQAVLDLMSEHITDNVRQLEGMVNRLITINDLGDEGDPIFSSNTEKMMQVVKEIVVEREQLIPTKELIIREVCDFFEITEEEIRGTGRSQNILVPRNIAIFLIRKLVKTSLIEIGKEFTGRDHTTIMNCLKSIEKKMEKDPGIRATIEDIKNNINSKFYNE
ncbi:MAG: chromosomal replication initiator protein DnaA [Eubacteriales bacterium]